jgi:hypothetical protein
LRHTLTLIATVALVASSTTSGASAPFDTAEAQQTALTAPESIRTEHEAIHNALVEATKAPGQVGAAAKQLATVLHPQERSHTGVDGAPTARSTGRARCNAAFATSTPPDGTSSSVSRPGSGSESRCSASSSRPTCSEPCLGEM